MRNQRTLRLDLLFVLQSFTQFFLAFVCVKFVTPLFKISRSFGVFILAKYCSSLSNREFRLWWTWSSQGSHWLVSVVLCVNRGQKMGNWSRFLLLVARSVFSTRKCWSKSTNTLYLNNIFHVAVCWFSNRSQMTSKCGKNKKSATPGMTEYVTDSLTTFWHFLWSITVQTYSNMEYVSVLW